MTEEQFFALAADAVLIAHVLLVVFIVGGVLAIWIGRWVSWLWIRNYWFRVLHLAAMVVVMLQAWLGMICPLTVWEMQLRVKADEATYQGSFIQHWLQAVLYYDAPEWLFILGYTLVAGLILAAWFFVPPKRKV